MLAPQALRPVPSERSLRVPCCTSALVWAPVPLLGTESPSCLHSLSLRFILHCLPTSTVFLTGRRTEGDLLPTDSSEHTGHTVLSLCSGARLCSRTPPSPCSFSLSPPVQGPPLRCLGDRMFHSTLAFTSLIELFLLPQYTFICQPKTCASRACLLLESFLNGLHHLWTPANFLDNIGNLYVQGIAQ